MPPARGTGSFYYDYTEEFENEAPYEPEYAAPLCPIPQRAGGTRHPFLLRTDGTETTDDSDTPPTIDSSGTNFKGGLYKDNYSSDSMLAERGSIAQLSEGSQRDLLANEEVDGEKIITACQEDEQFREGFPEIPAPSRPENQLSQLEVYAMTTKGRAGRGRHRRNPATTTIAVPKDSIPAVPNPGEGANVEMPILSPSPISAAKQLRNHALASSFDRTLPDSKFDYDHPILQDFKEKVARLFSTNHTIKHDEYGAGHQRRNGQFDPIY
ncbi:hypothetical protein CDV31_005870 [Fusarium ambrosium]|uniref:Uncharacterized protein n=1 Tax=Fusarium ambrosium TaxID=131363 RepID=A0A428UGP2_9HYPO|nr:hypothetical protein CDV31_005870 [Fusarium ambrosium]